MHQFSIFKFLISVLLIFVPQFEDFVTKSNQSYMYVHFLIFDYVLKLSTLVNLQLHV